MTFQEAMGILRQVQEKFVASGTDHAIFAQAIESIRQEQSNLVQRVNQSEAIMAEMEGRLTKLATPVEYPTFGAKDNTSAPEET